MDRESGRQCAITTAAAADAVVHVLSADDGETHKGGGYSCESTAIRPRYNRCTLRPTCSWLLYCGLNKLRGRPLQYAPAPCKLTFDLLTLKVAS